ncbi:hypothetical protein KOI35_28880 [Actinoplanes bogorensis]|uniref:Uncharacterized protein n=1 Tax=Paractinoplanes bogorensis TaxID=1610840 RepID=A0ABS5YVT8_9ACTN|nr:hypothetical protein [Actinoplanes bogorensis]MBU2667535.1 hypothetical protein [Actinoplanes bogorensis]
MDQQTLWAWLHPHLGTTTGGGRAPREYVAALRGAARALDADPSWRKWWEQTGLLACELGIVVEGRLDHLRPSADLRRLDDCLLANFTCALSADTGPGGCTRAAVDEVREMFEVIRQALALPALPPVPPVPALPTDLADMPITAKRLPEAPHEPEQQGHLTLIQEFFA